MKYLLLLLLPFQLFSETHKITGLVLDDSTHEALPYATIRVEQTDIVTSSNKEGSFLLELPSGDYSLLVTYVGYHANTVGVSVPAHSNLRVSLAPAVIQMPEVAVSADDEDPAMEIMRTAIKRREKNYEGLKNYDITGYKKNIFFKGNTIAMIEEKFIRHLYDKGRMAKEFVYSTHKTENIKNQRMNINLNVGWALFFVNGSLNIGVGNAKSQSVFPLADNAMKYYTFKLVQTKFAGKNATHIIQVIPRTELEPLVRGKLFIDDATGAVIGADIETNGGWHMPMVKGFRMTIQQTYANYNGFWIPQYSELSLAGELSALGGLISMDRMELSEVFSSSACKVNGSVPDSLRLAKRSKYGGYTADTTKLVVASKRYYKTKRVPVSEDAVYEPAAPPPELTASAMNTMRPLPLTAAEVTAFAQLDSTQTLDKVFQPQGALGALASSGNTEPGAFNRLLTMFRRYGMLHNNRVEGIAPGMHYEIDQMDDLLYCSASASYAFGLKRVEGTLGGGINLGDDHLDRIDANVWDKVRPWQQSGDISKTVNTLAFTLTGRDYSNYVRSTGFNIGIHKYFTDYSYVKLYADFNRQRSVEANAYVSIWKERRPNPSILEGNDHTLQLQCGYESVGESRFGRWGTFAVQMAGMVSLQGFGSDFDYQRLYASANLRVNTMYSTMFASPYLAVRVDAAGVTGNKFGIQHMPVPMTSLAFYAPSGVLKGVHPYELAGEKFVAMQAEQNWQALPMLALGWKSSGLQFITGASMANVWNTTSYYAFNNAWKPYWEAYVGVGGILDVLRINVVRTSKKQSVIRLGVATAF